jgi:hypothetical protein
MYSTILKFISILGIILVGGCARIPPKVDLKPYNQIGVVHFELENARGNIGDLVASKLIRVIKKSQRKANLIKLGSPKEIQQRIGKSELYVKAIGDEYEVDAVFMGKVILSKIEAHIEESGLSRNLKVLADVILIVEAQLISATTGEVLWENSVTEKREFSQIRVGSGTPQFAASDPNRAYGLIIEDLIYKLTLDFRSR